MIFESCRLEVLAAAPRAPELMQGHIQGSHLPHPALIPPCFSDTKQDPHSLLFWQSLSRSCCA